MRGTHLETWFHLFQEEESDMQKGPPPDPQDWLGPGSRCLVVQPEPNTLVSHRSLHAGCFQPSESNKAEARDGIPLT